MDISTNNDSAYTSFDEVVDFLDEDFIFPSQEEFNAQIQQGCLTSTNDKESIETRLNKIDQVPQDNAIQNASEFYAQDSLDLGN